MTRNAGLVEFYIPVVCTLQPVQPARQTDNLARSAPRARPPEHRELQAACWMLTMRNRLLCLFLLVVFFFRWLHDKWPTPYRACHNNTPILVGTHHKTGTVLLQHILKDACRLLAKPPNSNRSLQYSCQCTDATTAHTGERSRPIRSGDRGGRRSPARQGGARCGGYRVRLGYERLQELHVGRWPPATSTASYFRGGAADEFEEVPRTLQRHE